MNILRAAGARVHVPLAQVCCGKPAHGAGDMETAFSLAVKNLTVFNPDEFDYLVAFCATCSEQLKGYHRLEGLDIRGGWTEKIRDFSQFLIDDLDWRPETDQAARLRVFYHDPCHLRRKQGIFMEPRALIEALPGVELVGQDLPPSCCGYGGLFNLWHYDLSREIFKTRIEELIRFKPDAIVTSCSGCLLQFEDNIRKLGLGLKVLSLTELIASRFAVG